MLVTGVLFNQISPARISAYEVLAAVSEGAYASDSLLLRTKDMDGRDAGLASQIVFGCLRFQGQLDYLITLYSGRRLPQIDPRLLIALRMGIFQLRYLDRIPTHAAVNETVELVKRHRKAAGGFANAVLRKVNRKPVRWPDIATQVSCPEWLVKRWISHFGQKEALNMALAALEEPSRYIRVPSGANPPEGVKAECTDIDGCFLLLSPPAPGARLQDIGSQAVLGLLDLRPGQTYLDLCAAPGNKTLQALETPLSLTIACDVSETRARQIPPVCPRLVLDATRPLPFRKKFDRIFVDAPCSGTGTLARNPEIKWRVQENDFLRFQKKQVQIVTEALRHLAPGGRLVYATCSLESEENEAVIRKVLWDHPQWRLAGELRRLPGRDAGDGFYGAALHECVLTS